MQTFIGFLGDLGWGVTIGIMVLIVAGAVFVVTDLRETKTEKARRRSSDAARKETR
jgi:hypothetical protein